MKKSILFGLTLFVVTMVGWASGFTSNAYAEVRSATKIAQDDARKAGKKNAEDRKSGKAEKNRAKNDDYKNMTREEKESYKKGYREGQ